MPQPLTTTLTTTLLQPAQTLQPSLHSQALLRWPHVEAQLGTTTLARLRAYVAAGPFATTAALAVPRVADAMAM